MSSDAKSGILAKVCVGQPRDFSWGEDVVRTGIVKSEVAGPVRANRLGLDGDGQADLAVHGGVDKAVYALDQSSIDYWTKELRVGPLSPGAFGENLVLQGFAEEDVQIGDQLSIGHALMEVSQPRQPCYKLGKRFDDPTLPKRFIKSGRVGYYLRVLTEGEIQAGDSVVRTSREQDAIDIRGLVSTWLNKHAGPTDLERALASPALAAAWRDPLNERLDRSSSN